MSGPSFSARTAWDTSHSPLAQAIEQARAAGKPLLDLAQSNPTQCGFVYDEAAILTALSDTAALRYDPDPRGLLSARSAVARYYSEHGADLDPNHVVLTTSTSEAYSFLLRLLCDPGDEVLVAQPCYPLFEYLASLDHVQLKSYPLFYDFGWWCDLAELERQITPRTRAILLVHPNNPTGHFTSRGERHRLESLCVQHGLALVIDEVFLDYPVLNSVWDAVSDEASPDPNREQPASFATGPHPALIFVVSGLSKIAALPQMKVGWLAVCGPEPQVSAALARLEVIADTFLSMSAPSQLALPVWLGERRPIIHQIQARVRDNLAHWRASGLNPLPVQAGWNAVLRLPAWVDARPEALVEQIGVIVHAGEFYGFAGRGWIVISLIVPESACREAVGRLAQWVAQQQTL